MAALHARCFTLPRPWSAAEFSDLLADRSVFALTLPGAFLLGRSVLDEAEILTLAVAPEARRQGLARQLLSQFHSAAMGRGAARAFLEVAETNAPAIALYQNVGWQQAGRRRAYFTAPGQVPQDALVMTISLDASATNGA
ncbi:GNAT family N-acetyltransferase [Tabrizicola sp. DMG-N-6]|uniref:GNAT family N-acetyltransferase n=2 Tax=Szabonella alba TaxID=2804194 RepID=A0A8K0VA84_9RHOB|nr:GNAT family N-acetyltransferase [Szabonella alba]MBL4917966.1 GNAT family N-acetyltransferase [Szabonella alba]